MAQKKEYPPIADAVKSLENTMRVFARECQAGSTWTRLNTLSERIFERRRVLEIVYSRTFPAQSRPRKLREIPTPELLERAKGRIAELSKRR